MEDVTRIRSGEVLLRRPTYADVAGLHRVHSDGRVYAFDQHLIHSDEQHTAEWARPFLQHWQDHGFGYWTVLVHRDWWTDGPPSPAVGEHAHVIAGAGGIQNHRLLDEDLLNVYFRLAPEVHGRGLAGSIVTAAVGWAGRHRPGTDLVVRTSPDNAPAVRVAQRAGFVVQGPDPRDASMLVLRRRTAGESPPSPAR